MRKLRSLEGFPRQRKRKLLKKWDAGDAQIKDMHRRADALMCTMPFLPSVRERENAVIQAGELRSLAYKLALSRACK